MSAIQAKMTVVATDLVNAHGVPPGVASASDFLSWLTELAKELIPIIVACFASTEKVVEAAHDPNFFQEFRLRQMMRRKILDDHMERRMLAPLAASVLKMAKTLTAGEWDAMVSE